MPRITVPALVRDTRPLCSHFFSILCSGVLEPTVQHVGIHSMLPGRGCNGNAGLLTGRHQFGFELCRVGAVGMRCRILPPRCTKVSGAASSHTFVKYE